MTTYNREKFIAEAVESVLMQSFQDWELIIIDDASEDGTENIVKKYSDEDKRIKYYKNQTNLGIVKSRNLALRKSEGRFIAILDSDDVWCEKEKLKLQYDIMDKDDCVLVGTGVQVVGENGKNIQKYFNPLSDKQIRHSILSRNPFAHSSIMYNKDMVLKIEGYRQGLLVGEDYDLCLRLGLEGKMQNLNILGLKYRIHSQNISRRKRLVALKNNLSIIKLYRKVYPNYFRAYIRRNIRLLIGRLVFKV